MRSTGFGTVLFRAGVVGALVCAAVAASPTLIAWHRGGLARGLAEELSTLDAPGAKRAVRRIAALDLAGLPQLLDAAASPREAVAREARLAAGRQLAEWEARYEGEALAERLAALIVGVEQRVDRMGDAGRRWAEQIALRVVDLADQAPPRQSAVLIRAGGEVLAATPPRGPRLRNVTTQTLSSDSVSTTPGLSGFKASLVPAATPALPAGIAEQPAVTSGAVDDTAVERLPLVWGDPERAVARPGPAEDGSSAEAIEPTPSLGDSAATEPPAREGPSRYSPGDQPSLAIPTPGELLLMASRLRRLPSPELVRRMQASDRFEAEQARRILAERGVGERQLKRASDLFSSDPAVRARAVGLLAAWPPGEARAWLRAMLDDPDAGVRVRALTQLAVAKDPRVEEFARELERRDPDERVADAASRILEDVAR